MCLECFKIRKKFQEGKVNRSDLYFLSVYLEPEARFPKQEKSRSSRSEMLILGEVHFLVTEKNRGVTSLQTGYLLIVRFKYTKFSIVALNFWSHGHRMHFGCCGVVAGDPAVSTGPSWCCSPGCRCRSSPAPGVSGG